MFKETIINECLLILKREDIKNELKHLLTPLIDLILVQIYPYLYLSLMFVLISVSEPKIIYSRSDNINLCGLTMQ